MCSPLSRDHTRSKEPSAKAVLVASSAFRVTFRPRELVAPRRLLRRQRQAHDVRAVLPRDVPRRAADAAPDVQHAQAAPVPPAPGGHAVRAAELERLLDHVVLRLDVARERRRLLSFAVVPMMHVLPPDLLPDPRALVVELADPPLELRVRARLHPPAQTSTAAPSRRRERPGQLHSASNAAARASVRVTTRAQQRCWQKVEQAVHRHRAQRNDARRGSTPSSWPQVACGH